MKKSTLLLALPLFLLMLIAACTGKNEPTQPAGDEVVMDRTAEDSTSLLSMATAYLDALKAGNINAALDMLHAWNGNEVVDLSPEYRERLTSLLQNFPVINYEIERMVLNSEEDTRVDYLYEFFEKPEGMENINNTMRGSLSPHRVDGKWLLVVDPDRFVYEQEP